MKFVKIFVAIFSIILLLGACVKDFSVNLSQNKFVRIDKQEVHITIGEKYRIKARTDTLPKKAGTLMWSILDPTIATIESKNDSIAIITGLSEGTTVIKVNSSDESIQYYSDLIVGKDRVIKILAIGNSFSEDAIENYLYDLAKAAGHKITIDNMYIGGSSLENHWTNASENRPAYQLRHIDVDGKKTAINNMTIKEAIGRENWDYISLQEVSQRSGKIEGYAEFLPKLKEYILPLTSNPELKFVLHQTWAYAKDSDHSGFLNYDRDQMKMFNSIVDVAGQAKELAKMDIIVPAGTAIQNGRTSYIGDRFTRDGYHLSLSLGRFTAASTWYETLFENILTNSYIPDNLSTYDALLAKTAAYKAVANPKIESNLVNFKYPEPNDFLLTSPVFIDFGGVVTSAPFNNFKHPNEVKLSNLHDAAGNNTNFAMEVSEPFSGVLDRGLKNILGFPQSVSQDMFFTDGIRIGQSSLTLTNLNPAIKYSFVFYGSINDDNTETDFTVIGKNQATKYLDNDNNLGKFVVISDIEAKEDATITIRMKPGPNNTQFAKFFGLNAMIILPQGMDVPIQNNDFVLQNPVFIDFGKTPAGSPFNHVLSGSGSDANIPYFDLVDDKTNNTGIALSFTDKFVNINESGALTNTFGWPAAVSQDAIYGDKNNAVGVITLYNLNPDQEYQFVFYGSRRGVADNREAKYLVRGQNEGSALLNGTNNATNLVKVKGIKPDSKGVIDVMVTPGPNNNNGDKFFYLNAMIIAPDSYVP